MGLERAQRARARVARRMGGAEWVEPAMGQSLCKAIGFLVQPQFLRGLRFDLGNAMC